ncbi:hypothetical protein PInf_022887 [Phytophthora infestans]|nr:hypothetical protein PInf_022887 [Phytophthora infestans]
MTGKGESRCLDPMVDPTKLKMNKDLHAEDLGEGMAVVPEVPRTTEEVTIDDFQVDPGANEPAEVDRLRQKIWESQHLLIGKSNALPPAARGVKCDIDVSDAKPIAQRVGKWFLGGDYDGSSSRNIRIHHTVWTVRVEPDAEPDLAVEATNPLKKEGAVAVDPAEATAWDDGAIVDPGFRFGLKNAPQIYQRLIDNALYGFTRIPEPEKGGSGEYHTEVDPFEAGEPGDPGTPSVLGRQSYIDGILIPT